MMEEDFFSDLLSVKSNGTKSSRSNEDAVLPVVAEPANGVKSGSDLLGTDTAPPPKPLGPPMGESRGKKELRDFETATQVIFEATLKRFAAGLQRVLEDINRCVGVGIALTWYKNNSFLESLVRSLVNAQDTRLASGFPLPWENPYTRGRGLVCSVEMFLRATSSCCDIRRQPRLRDGCQRWKRNGWFSECSNRRRFFWML